MENNRSNFSSRRHFLVGALTAAGISRLACEPVYAAIPPRVPNVTGLYTVEVAGIETPRSTKEVAKHVSSWPGQVAIGGGRFSMGGQVAVQGGLHLDMRKMNQIVWLRPEQRLVRVQAGMTWRDLQDHLDPLGLAVKTMQSYSGFTTGGSAAVNVHGRYVGHGPIVHSIRALQLVLADGSVLECTREQNTHLFRAAIGAYGAIGVITELELELADNVRIERTVEEVALDDYVAYFDRNVRGDPAAILHNADLQPPNFNMPVAITWRKVGEDRPLTQSERLVPRGQSYSMEKNFIWALTEIPGGTSLRKKWIHPRLLRPEVKWLNHEASLDVAQLEPRTRVVSTYVLQEYFLPPKNLVAFVRAMAGVLRRHQVEALNISIRHSPRDAISVLAWAQEEVFSCVLYFKQRTWPSARDVVESWTRELIELALAFGGRYYLPYQLHATRAQFERAYPEIDELREIKRQVDPDNKFSNELWRKYL